jgi:signal transduction histidine kinase
VPKEVLHPALKTIDKQVKNLIRLISELLDLSKINKGQLVLHKELFSLNKLLTETIHNTRFTAAKHTIRYTEAGNYYVMADKERIEQVINNLLSNAVKYSPDAENIELSVFPSGKDHVAVSIKDYGIGIESTEQQKVFERFYRVAGKNEQTYPGFGIGLFIVQDIIKRHNGTIYLDSEKDKGSVFTFTLPLAET